MAGSAGAWRAFDQPHPAITARIVLETLVFWAVHRSWDPSPQEMEDKAAEDAVVSFILGSLLWEDAS